MARYVCSSFYDADSWVSSSEDVAFANEFVGRRWRPRTCITSLPSFSHRDVWENWDFLDVSSHCLGSEETSPTSCPDTRGGCQNDSNASVSSTPSLHEDAQRELVGLGIFAAAVGLPGWHVLPMFLNMKMAADPALPGLTEETLPIATTAIFVGWLAGATVLDRALEIFDKKQLVVLHVLGLLLVNFAVLTLPHLTAGNLVVFTVLRFAHGLLMNLTGLVRMYLMEKMPPSQGNQVLVLLSIIYTMATILMSWSCGRITMMIDWRLEGFLVVFRPIDDWSCRCLSKLAESHAVISSCHREGVQCPYPITPMWQ